MITIVINKDQNGQINDNYRISNSWKYLLKMHPIQGVWRTDGGFKVTVTGQKFVYNPFKGITICWHIWIMILYVLLPWRIWPRVYQRCPSPSSSSQRPGPFYRSVQRANCNIGGRKLWSNYHFLYGEFFSHRISLYGKKINQKNQNWFFFQYFKIIVCLYRK